MIWLAGALLAAGFLVFKLRRHAGRKGAERPEAGPVVVLTDHEPSRRSGPRYRFPGSGGAM